MTSPYPLSDREPAVDRYDAFTSTCHPDCVACRDRRLGGLGLRFSFRDDGGVEARFYCGPEYQGYPDRLHGGIIATLLDAAMTHCLFARNCRGVTAKLAIRYLRPVLVEFEAAVCGTLLEERPPLFKLRAEIRQEDQVCATAEGTFIGDRIAPNSETPIDPCGPSTPA